jgi:uncharacterized protein YjbI with pentapeptide repeats
MTKKTSNLIKANNDGVVLGLKNAGALYSETAALSATINPPRWRPFKADFSNANVFEQLNALSGASNSGQNTFINIDFSGSNFTNADFTYFANEQARNSGILSGLIMQGCKFHDCAFDNAIMAYTDVRWSDFTGATGLETVVIAEYIDGNAKSGSVTYRFGCVGL